MELKALSQLNTDWCVICWLPVCVSDLDRSRSVDDDNEAPEITLSPGQPLLLRCRERENSTTKWQTDIQEQVSVITHSWTFYSHCWKHMIRTISLSPPRLVHCISGNAVYRLFLQVSIYKLSYKGIDVTYLFCASVRVNHSGIYTCHSNKNKFKSIHIRVLGQYNRQQHWILLFLPFLSFQTFPWLYFKCLSLLGLYSSVRHFLSVLLLSVPPPPTCFFPPNDDFQVISMWFLVLCVLREGLHFHRPAEWEQYHLSPGEARVLSAGPGLLTPSPTLPLAGPGQQTDPVPWAHTALEEQVETFRCS